METEILIVSYLKDKPWLEYCLRSIRKFCTGFSGVTVLVPETEASEFAGMVAGFGCRLTTYIRGVDPTPWHLHAQAMKCYADIYCPNADFILHTDSDCIFTEPVTPEDYFDGVKPVMLYESYSRLHNNPWQPVVEAVLEDPVEFEFMRRHPQINPIEVYGALRSQIERLHPMPFLDYVLSRKPNFPWGFTEHNIIGAYAFYSPLWHDRYHWINLDNELKPHEKLTQFWSHAKIGDTQELPHGGHGNAASEFARLGL